MTLEARIKNPQRPFIRVAWLCFVGEIFALTAALMGNIDYAIAFAVFVPLLAGTLFAIWIFHRTGKRHIARVEELTTGDYLARWRVEAAVWNRFVADQRSRSRRLLWILPLSTTGLVALILAWMVIFDDFDLSLGITALILGIGFFTGLLIALPLVLGKRSRYKPTNSPVEVFIGTRGIYQGGNFFDLQYGPIRLIRVEFIHGDPALLEFGVTAYKSYGAEGDTIRVPVPQSRETEAQALVGQFGATDT